MIIFHLLLALSLASGFVSSFHVPLRKYYHQTSIFSTLDKPSIVSGGGNNNDELNSTTPSFPSTSFMDDIPSSNLVIVESPAKAKTIESILKGMSEGGRKWTVRSCNGHILDLSPSTPSNNLGIDIMNSYTPLYTPPPSKKPLIKELLTETSKADCIWLATDGDREGEAISSHLNTTLNPKAKIPTRRCVFKSITKRGVTEGITSWRNVDSDLVKAQESRRVLDRLAGYTVSPVLWRKIAPGLSAGRVQSVGLKIIVDKEKDRMRHVKRTYADVSCEFSYDGSGGFEGVGHSWGGERIRKGNGFNNEGEEIGDGRTLTWEDVDGGIGEITGEEVGHLRNFEKVDCEVVEVEGRVINREPPECFITSSLQIEGNRRLGLSASETMSAAQGLYEKGYITYMRTDNTGVSKEGETAGREEVGRIWGEDEIGVVKEVKKKAGKKKKGEKEKDDPHEAIRPSIHDGRFLCKEELGADVGTKERALYELVYNRTVARFMKPKITNSTTVTVDVGGKFEVKCRGSVTVDMGWGRMVGGGGGEDANSTVLPQGMGKGTKIQMLSGRVTTHVTQPPGRFNDASFVRELERLGVGRPSTYATVLETLRKRAYVRSGQEGRGNVEVKGGMISAQRAAGITIGKGRGQIIPSLTAFVVCDLLEKHLGDYVDTDFTKRMEERLDEIARGEAEGGGYLKQYYEGEKGLKRMVEIMEENVTGDSARLARLPSLHNSSVSLFVGPWGPYAVRESGGRRETAPIPGGLVEDLGMVTEKNLRSILDGRRNNGTLLGDYEGKPVILKLGRYGAYLQHGEGEGSRTQTLPKEMGGMGGKGLFGNGGRREEEGEGGEGGGGLQELIGITFDKAKEYLKLPRTVGDYKGEKIITSLGPYGPYLKWNNSFTSLPAEYDLITIESPDACRLVEELIVNKSGLARGVLVDFGKVDGGKLTVRDGRFGVYINWKKVNAKLPAEWKDNPKGIEKEEAWGCIEEKIEKGGGKKTVKKKKGGSKGGRKGGKKEEEKKGPQPPKRPLSAYLLFCADNRPSVSKTAKTLGDISKELARLWKEQEDRAEWEGKAEVLKKEYEVEKKKWEEECGVSGGGGGSSRKTVERGGKKVGRSPSAYMIYCKDKRKSVMEMKGEDGNKLKFGEVTQVLAKGWKSLGEKEREEYDEKAREAKEEMEREGREGEGEKV